MQGLGAAVQGIEALLRGDIGVRSLQDWARGRAAVTTYDALFEHVLTRVDPERAHHLGFAGIRAARLATRMYPGPATRPRRAPWA